MLVDTVMHHSIKRDAFCKFYLYIELQQNLQSVR